MTHYFASCQTKWSGIQDRKELMLILEHKRQVSLVSYRR